MEHVEFLDVSGSDPRRACAEGLVEHIGAEGTLVAYNAGFERRVIRELAELNYASVVSWVALRTTTLPFRWCRTGSVKD